MSDFKARELDVLRWAEARRILRYTSSTSQLLKTMSELGELADAILKKDTHKIRDGIGDVLVTLIIVAELEGMHLLECLDHAYDEIKDRTGMLNANGVFVKDG
jgi:NTP pyrophosphatase (non-canonical NTP hydrolase)